LRAADPRALDAYEAYGRIIPGTLEDHLGEIAGRWVDHHDRGDTVALVASSNDHVDQLNAAVQNLRVTVGDLDADTAVTIAGGEHAHVGDVVATRRNNRQVTTSLGEPVRNRELWTVTGTHPDGTLTVSHHEEHGQVTLPTEYVTEHVRLGYAATEHGYQSDTVTISINLASEATTRRGLYVAVTRGREENSIHVVTESADVTEARDVLERVLAVDRADIPAVTQRRQLAAQHQPPPDWARPQERLGRCEIPDWFDQVRDETRQRLAEAEQRATANATERERLEADLDTVRRDVDRLDQATRRRREELLAAQDELDNARRAHEVAEHRLERSGLRGRRHAHRDVAATHNRLTWADHTLEQLQAQASPDVECYHQAHHEMRQLREAVRRQELSELFDRYGCDRIPQLQQRLDALDTWWRFATGDRIAVGRLGELVDILSNVAGDHGHYRRLADTVWQYCHDAGIKVSTPSSPTTTRELSRPELAL
jgi:hypothetical protein